MRHRHTVQGAEGLSCRPAGIRALCAIGGAIVIPGDDRIERRIHGIPSGEMVDERLARRDLARGDARSQLTRAQPGQFRFVGDVRAHERSSCFVEVSLLFRLSNILYV